MNFKLFLETEDYANQISSGDWNGKHFSISVGKAYDFARKGKYLVDISVAEIIHDLSWWDGDKKRMIKADTRYPLLVLKMPNGHLTVADGLNRLKKATSIEKKKQVQAYVVPFNDLPKNVFVDEALESSYHTNDELVEKAKEHWRWFDPLKERTQFSPLTHLKVNEIRPNLGDYSEKHVLEILALIESEQPLPPIIVRKYPHETKYTILDGTHRHLASIKAKLPMIPVLIRKT